MSEENFPLPKKKKGIFQFFNKKFQTFHKKPYFIVLEWGKSVVGESFRSTDKVPDRSY